MHLSLARSAGLMWLLLFAVGNFVGVQPGQITRDVDNGQLADNRRNLQSLRKPMTLFKSLNKRVSCGEYCGDYGDCPSSCPTCTSNLLKCM
uniref:Conotoxin ba9a n=1 Tax=Conus bayani TaxID=2070216 RepID=CP9A_CONBY|nr:RecName: Full=Conotoxin ba9a; Flags: Precursor [Conus bayani]